MNKRRSEQRNHFPERPRDKAGVLAETDARWQGFEALFDGFDTWDAAWQESDDKKRRVERVQALLNRGELPSPLDQAKFFEGLNLSLEFFSKKQFDSLVRVVKRLGEGLAERRERERFEKGMKEGGTILEERGAFLDLFDALLVQYYELVARLAMSGQPKAKIEALMRVAWTSVEACAAAIQEAARQGKSVTEMELIVLRFEQQLQALDPEDPFVPSKSFSDLRT